MSMTQHITSPKQSLKEPNVGQERLDHRHTCATISIRYMEMFVASRKVGSGLGNNCTKSLTKARYTVSMTPLGNTPYLLRRSCPVEGSVEV